MAPLIFLVTVTLIQTVHLLCLNEPGITTEDRYLENNLYGIIKERGLVERECAVECMSHSDCLSFGFEPSLGLCHLHMEDSDTALMDLVEKTGWKHSDVSQWPKELMGPCADHSCPPGRRCSMHRVTKAAVCKEGGAEEAQQPVVSTSVPLGVTQLVTWEIYNPVLIKVNIMNTNCEKPLADVYVCSEDSHPHATCSYESKLTGGTRSCTCHSNCLDVPLDVLSVNNTCMKNGSWSTPTINCSGPYLKFNSPVLRTYTFLPLPGSSFRKMTGGNSSIVYLVKTCNDAQIALDNRPDTIQTDAYEIIIGGYQNTLSLIRQCRGCPFLINHTESSMLSCQEYRPFWLSWKKDIISVGKGHIIGNQTFMEYVASGHIDFNHVGVSSFINNQAVWLFKEL